MKLTNKEIGLDQQALVLEMMTNTLLVISDRQQAVSQELERTDAKTTERIIALQQANQQLVSENQQLKTEIKHSQGRDTQLETGSKANEVAAQTLIQNLQGEVAFLQHELEKLRSELSDKTKKLDVFEKEAAEKAAQERFKREHPELVRSLAIGKFMEGRL